jgi:hypothetical protein
MGRRPQPKEGEAMIRDMVCEVLALIAICLMAYLLLIGVADYQEQMEERNARQFRHHYMEGRIR